MDPLEALRAMPDSALLERSDALVERERREVACLLAVIGEVDRRRLHLWVGYSTMFEYCVGRWKYSRDDAYRRLHAARACRRHPQAYAMIQEGSMTISALATLEPFLADHGGLALIEKAKGLGRREIEQLVAALAPRPDTKDVVRALPLAPLPTAEAPAAQTGGQPSPPSIPAVPPPRDHMEVTAPRRVLFSFTGSEELRSALRRVGEILWHKHPFARLEDLILELARDFLSRHDPQRKLKLAEPKPVREEQTRRVPQWVRDRVWKRDGGRCAFTGTGGRRCEETRGLELDHVEPWSQGGSSDDPANIRLLCRAHNLMRSG